MTRALRLAAGTERLQFYEPLLAHALFVSDEGVPYGACLVVPTGRLDGVGNRGSITGPWVGSKA